ncbi:formylglycine-generating enzyme family protein [Nitrosomonas sp.]|uniref:formylglycine-generating enzyme family protein n=1 Tax=Nitrosomonas sp. TaxID=42353 RepID=UPI002089C759|nr:formylglycine-generating enzyme family protein [Nitrosomonas sp.]GJL76005.1 MAG: hypothetical protein NMNS02_21110 [Nitrosomonas sp.]
MAWGRLALIQAAGESEQALRQVATLFGYEELPEKESPQSRNRPDGWTPADTGQQSVEEEQSVAQVIRPPARFLCVNQTQSLDNPEQTQRPHYLDDPKMRLPLHNPQPGTYCFAAPRPLMPLSRLLPFLLNSLGRLVMNGRIDHRKLARQISQGKPLRRLPYRNQQRWPQRLHIIVDCRTALEPFWPDFESLVAALKKLLGEEAVDAVRLDDDRLDRNDCLCIAWPGECESNRYWRRWQPPAVDTSILILSDLGEAEPNGHAQIRWQRFSRRLQTHTAPILTLSPARQSPENRLVCRLFRPNPFNDWHSLPRHPGRDGFAQDASEHEQLDEELNDILAQLSVLPLVDSGLLRRLRDALQWGGSALESVIWNHPDMLQMGLGIRLKASAAEFYRQRYQQKFAKSDTARKIWTIVEDHHQAAFAGLKQLEKFNQCLLEDTHDEVMLNYMRSVCATLAHSGEDAGRRRALQQQCRTILASKPDSVWIHRNQAYRDLGYQLFAFAYEDEIRAGKWPHKLEPGFDPVQLQWLFDEKQSEQQVTWLVAQTGDQGQFVLLQHDKTEADGETVVAPICSLQAQAQIPPILALPSGERIPIQHGTQVNVPHERAIELHTPWQRLELTAAEKPAWAHAIFWDDNQLRAAMTIAGTTHQFTWMSDQTDNASASVCRWINQNPRDVVQFDDYGLYFDLTIDGVTQRFRWIDPGTFQMGSPETEAERNNDELLHPVTISKGFWLADTACTQALWQAMMDENPSYFKGESLPVEQVNWDDVQAFIKTVNSQFAGLQLRLPIEAEWEYACRAGTETPFSFGDTITTDQVNFDGNYPYAGGKKGIDRSKTVAVKSLPANPWGLYEMHGNVWEWCQDWYGEYPKDLAVDPQGPPSGGGRVVRGGSWVNVGRGVRSADRYRYAPDLRFNSLGFRLALGHVEPGQGSFDEQPLRDEAAGHHKDE